MNVKGKSCSMIEACSKHMCLVLLRKSLILASVRSTFQSIKNNYLATSLHSFQTLKIQNKIPKKQQNKHQFKKCFSITESLNSSWETGHRSPLPFRYSFESMILGPRMRIPRHHRDDITFLVGNPNLNLHLRLASWVGG